MTVRPSGVIPSLVTPLRSPGELDLRGMAALVEQAMGGGASAVLVAGATGEGVLLSPADRRAVTAAAKATGAMVLAGASGATLGDVHADVERLAGAGADAVVVMVPGVLPLSAEELADAHIAVADRAAAPTVVGHAPRLTGSGLTAAAVDHLARHPGIAGLLDASPDAARRAAFVTAAGDAAVVLSGHAASLVEDLAVGVSGTVLAIANLRLQQVREVVTAGGDAADRSPDPVEVRRTHASLVACEASLQAVGTSMPAALKAALQLGGVIDERWCVPPLHSVPPNLLDRVRTALLR